MTFKFALSAFALAAGVAVMAMPVSATGVGSLAPLKGFTAGQATLLDEVHFAHKTCKRGLNGWHRHVPGVGRLQCTNKRCTTNALGVSKCVYF